MIMIWGLPLITYAPRGGGGGSKPPIHFHCVLHAKRGEGVQIAFKHAYVINGRPLFNPEDIVAHITVFIDIIILTYSSVLWEELFM